MVKRTEKPEGHETRDISVRAVASFAAALTVCTSAIGFAVVGFYKFLEHEHPSPESPSRIELNPHMLAPAPQLQTDPTVDLEKFQAAQRERLNSYGWVDQQKGVVRIPIERAMDLIAQRGLPTRSDGTLDASGVTTVQMQERKAASTK